MALESPSVASLKTMALKFKLDFIPVLLGTAALLGGGFVLSTNPTSTFAPVVPMPTSWLDPPQQIPEKGPCPPFGYNRYGGSGGPPNSASMSGGDGGSGGGAGSSIISGGAEAGICVSVNSSPRYIPPNPCVSVTGYAPFPEPKEEGGGYSPDKSMGTPSDPFFLGPAGEISHSGDSHGGGGLGGSGGVPALDSPFIDADSGNLTILRLDMSLRGGAVGFDLGRIYRSGLYDYNSVIGAGWELNILKRVYVTSAGGNGRPDEFIVQEGNGLQSGIFSVDAVDTDWYRNSERIDEFQFQYEVAPSGGKKQLVHYLSNGNREIYSEYQSGGWYHLTRSEDIWGNGFSLDYSDSVTLSPTPWTLTTLTDDLGRVVTFSYDAGHGRLARVEAKMGTDLIAEVDYSYVTQNDGTVVLDQVKRGNIATEDSSGNLTMTRETESYIYEEKNNADLSYDNWRLSGVVNGAGVQTYEWDYYSVSAGMLSGKAYKQIDRPNGTQRAPGIHTYTYSTLQNTYTSPDGKSRAFDLDNKGRIEARHEYLDEQNPTVATTVRFVYDDTTCSTCAKISEVHLPDGSYTTFHYDAIGNLISQWWYPATGSNLSPRVERWLWSGFDPISGKLRVRLLEYELQRDAAPTEAGNPNACCIHPSAPALHGAAGHHVNFYYWSDDEKKLTSIDYGTIQNSPGSAGGSISRSATFTYFADGRLKQAEEREDGNSVSRIDYLLDSSGAYMSSITVEDTLNATSSDTSWETIIERTPGSFFLKSVTGSDGTKTEYSTTSSGQVYRIKENSEGSGTSRTTDVRFDAAGHLIKVETVASDGTSERVDLRLDESGFPYEVEATGTSGIKRLGKLTYTLAGLPTVVEDWRGWKQETIYGIGSLQLPTEIKEYFGGQSKTVWQAGTSSSDTGYDNMGRLTSSRNVAGWESHWKYNDRGGLQYAFQQIDATHFATQAYSYDERGFVKEKEVGTLAGNPATASPSDFTWLQHFVYSHNLVGHLLSQSVYEDGNTVIARRADFTTDGRGRVIRTEIFQGDRAQPNLATPFVREVDFDALNRPLQIRSLESSSASTTIRLVNATYEAASHLVTFAEILPAGATRTITQTSDALGRPVHREESASGITRSWQYEHDGFDRPSAFTDPLGKRTDWAGDDFGNLLSETITPSSGSGNQVTAYTYDSSTGVLLTATDAAGKVTSYTTTDWLRPHTVTYPDGRTFSITEYDALGRRTKTMDDRGVQHSYTYDYSYLLQDIVTKPSGGLVPGPDALVWQYDRLKGTVLNSQVWEGAAASWVTTYTHNSLGEKTAETQGTGADAMTWGWDFGFAGELRDVTYPAGLGIASGIFNYDNAGRMQTIDYFSGGNALASDLVSYNGYRVTSRKDTISGLDTNFGYDAFGRLNHLDWSKDVSGTATMLDGQDRAFDLANHVTSRQRALDTVGDVFVHDGYGRMKSWYRGVTNATSMVPNATPAAGNWSSAEHYTLNAVYGRTQVTEEIDGGSSTTQDYVSNDSHFYTSVGGQPRTEQSGRLNFDGTHYYRWDAWGRLAEVDNSTGQLIRRHHYDAEGRRVRTEEIDPSNGTAEVERLVYWGARLAATFAEGATKTNIRTYGYAGGADGESFVVLTASVAPLVDGSYALARDFQGSILALIDRTSKNVVERYRYGVFGQVSIEDAQGQPLTESAYGNDRFFLGKPFDAEVGIYDLRARWYDPDTGSFLSPDPFGPADSWNMYQYGFGTPGTWMDPFGLQSGGAGGVLWDNALNGLPQGEYTPPGGDSGAGEGGDCFGCHPEQTGPNPLAGKVPTLEDFVSFLIEDFITLLNSDASCAERAMAGFFLLTGGVGKVGKLGVKGFKVVKAISSKVDDVAGAAKGGDDLVDLASSSRRRHILDGDRTGGGHRAGTGLPGKSEFPSGWSDDQIMHHISDIATDPAAMRTAGRGGRTIVDGTRGGVDIRVVLEPNGSIVTGFPTNVPRNPR